jgi:hypothetical protein
MSVPAGEPVTDVSISIEDRAGTRLAGGVAPPGPFATTDVFPNGAAGCFPRQFEVRFTMRPDGSLTAPPAAG